MECPRPWQAAPERTHRGTGKTRSSRFSAVTEASCLRAAKEDFHTSSILAGAIKRLQGLPSTALGVGKAKPSGSFLTWLDSAIHPAEKGIVPAAPASPRPVTPRPCSAVSPSQTRAVLPTFTPQCPAQCRETMKRVIDM